MPTPITDEQAAKLLEDTAQLQRAYQIAFGTGEASQAVLADLGKFCRADEPCWSEDQRHHARYEGRREVWLRIQTQMKSSVEDLLERRLGYSYEVVKIEPEDEENG